MTPCDNPIALFETGTQRPVDRKRRRSPNILKRFVKTNIVWLMWCIVVAVVKAPASERPTKIEFITA